MLVKRKEAHWKDRHKIPVFRLWTHHSQTKYTGGQRKPACPTHWQVQRVYIGIPCVRGFHSKVQTLPCKRFKVKKNSNVAVYLILKYNRVLDIFPQNLNPSDWTLFFFGRNLHRVECCFSQYWFYIQKGIEVEMIYFYWFSVAEPSHKIGMGLSPASNHSKYMAE